MQEMSGYTEVRTGRRGCEGIHIAIWLRDSLFAFVGSWGSTSVLKTNVVRYFVWT